MKTMRIFIAMAIMMTMSIATTSAAMRSSKQEKAHTEVRHTRKCMKEMKKHHRHAAHCECTCHRKANDRRVNRTTTTIVTTTTAQRGGVVRSGRR